jgi:uncharacterized protein YvpB
MKSIWSRRSTRTFAALLLAASAMLATTVGSEASYRTSRVNWVPLYRQIHGLDCEAAALQMALGHERIYVSQNRLLNATGIDWRMPTTDGTGLHWGDPFTSFVGNPDGSEIRMTGYGTYAPAIARVAQQFGGRVLASGSGIAPSTVYGMLLSGHAVVAWVSFDWRWHQTSQYVAFDGATVPFGSPYEHAVTLYGVTPGYVLVNNPWHGYRQWISKRRFEAAYATFGDMAVVLS